MHNVLSGEDLQTLNVVCRQVAAKQKGLLAKSHLTKDDLSQECAAACLRRAASYDPTKGKWRSWCWRVAYSRSIDLFRSASVQDKHLPRCEFVENIPQPVSVAENRSLATVAASAMDAAGKLWPAYARRGPRRFTKPQLAALIALRHHLNVSYAAIRMALAASQDLQNALGMTRLPCRDTFYKAERSLRRESLKDEHTRRSAHRPKRLPDPLRPAGMVEGSRP